MAGERRVRTILRLNYPAEINMYYIQKLINMKLLSSVIDTLLLWIERFEFESKALLKF